eukprot:TRINITY_DN18363_c0_g1_i1.p1 TRINITY_DN18363_c0_g1~~TRINITY_DN18363_c0_g1_i1.p1  ORF type:complete len:184 (+),score=29.31 TRINITY_DN18363_c0_g1_i1:76-627(+)
MTCPCTAMLVVAPLTRQMAPTLRHPQRRQIRRTEKKDHLRSLVHNFTADALKGVECCGECHTSIVVERATGARIEASYKLDAAVNWLRFTSRSTGAAIAAVQLPWITRLAAFPHLPPHDQEELLGQLGPADSGKCLQVTSGFSHSGGNLPQRVTVMMQDAPEMERFLTCVEVLRLYAAMDAPV